MPPRPEQTDTSLEPVDSTVLERLNSLEGLPPFPAVASRILAECQKADSDVDTVISLIECDAALGGRVLQLVNSPLYAASRQITSIGHAVVLLGFKCVAQMAAAIAAGEVFAGGSPEQKEHRLRTFERSLACATIARGLGQEMNDVSADEAFLAGVMHDVGKLVMLKVVPEDYCSILELFENGASVEEESRRFGIDHSALGKSCGNKWGLPNRINIAIDNHHLAFEDAGHNLSQVVIAANYVARKHRIAFDTDTEIETDSTIEEAFGHINDGEHLDRYREQFVAINEICSL